MIPFRFPRVLAAAWFGISGLLAASAPTVELHVPPAIAVGRTYSAQLRVAAGHDIDHGYVKFSLPTGLQQISGDVNFRGRIPAAGLQMDVEFRVVEIPEAPIGAKAYVCDEAGHIVAGRGDEAYFAETDAGTFEARRERPRPPAGISPDRTWVQTGRSRRLRNATQNIRPAIPIAEDATVSGTLTSALGTAYEFTGHKGDRMWITARSADFDPRLLLLASDGSVVAEDDDSLDGINPQIGANGVLELDKTDLYRLLIVPVEPSSAGRFTLKVQTFKTPDPTPIAPRDGAMRALATSGSVSLSGTVVYELPFGGTAPVRFAGVALVSAGILSDTVISLGGTDASGKFTLQVPQPNVTDVLSIDVFTADANGQIAEVKDQFLNIGLVNMAKHPLFTLPANAPDVTVGTWDIAETGANGAFLVFDKTVEGYLIARDVLGINMPLAHVTYPARADYFALFADISDTDAHYDRTNGEIVFNIGYGSSPDVVLHEYGHFVAHKSGFLAVAGGPHTLPFDHRIPPALAWNEGWASFFSVAGQNAHGSSSKSTFVSNHPMNSYAYDLEFGHEFISDAAIGDDNEGSVQFALWDLYDAGVDTLPLAGISDTASVPLKTIQSAAAAGALLIPSNNAVGTLEQFYDALFQQFSFSSTQSAAIAAVFRDQNMKWEVPPQPPVNLAFVTGSNGPQLQWQPGSANSMAYGVYAKAPGQSTFALIGSPTTTSFVPQSPISGTVFQVVAISFNSARYTAPFISGPSASVTYAASPAGLVLSASSLSFSFKIGGTEPVSQQVSISNSGTGPLQWSAVADSPWLVVAPGSGTAPSSLSVTIRTAGLTASTYSGNITVTAPGLAARKITVSLTVSGTSPASVSLTPATLSFKTSAGGPPSPAQTVAISTGTAAATWSATPSVTWIKANALSGTTPFSLLVWVDPTNLGPGLYSGTVRIVSGNATVSLSIGATVSPIGIRAVTEAAAFASGRVCAGCLVSIFGSGLSSSEAQARDLPLPNTIAGVYVSFNGILAPIIYVSPRQINVQAPYELTGSTAVIVVQSPLGSSDPFEVAIGRSTPGLLTVDGSGKGPGLVVDAESGTIISSSSPVPRLGYATVYATGLGPVSAQPATGASSSSSPLSETLDSPTVLVGGLPAPVLFSGLVPGFVGLYQVNIQIPEGVTPGPQVSLTASIAGKTSNAVTIAVK